MPPDEVNRALARAQLGIARAVARARAGCDADLAQHARDGGEKVAGLLAGLLKLTRVHAASNRAFDQPVTELVGALSRLVEVLGTVHLACVEDQVFVNEVRLRTDGTGAGDLGAELARHGCGGLVFGAALREEEVRALAALFAPGTGAPATAAERLGAGGPPGVELLPPQRFVVDDRPDLVPDHARIVQRLLGVAEDACGDPSGGGAVPVRLRRAVADLLVIGPEAPDLWEALEGAPDAVHAVAVTRIALLVGKAAGLSASFLQDLGVAALLHDVGYAAVAPEQAAGPVGLASHPALGARLLLRQRGFNLGKLRRLRAALDHHRDHADPAGRPSLAGRILRLAEDYTTILRVYAVRVSPAQVLGAMSRAAGRLYDPVLTQVMVNALGRYPPGTLLELATGQRVRSVSPVRSPETFATPLVRLVHPETGALSAERYDLARGGDVRAVLPG